MGTFLIFLCGLIVVSGLMFLVASFVFGRGEELAPMPADATPTELPDDRPIAGNDVRALRLTVSVRGYRMADVDWVLDQLATQLDGRDAELALLRHRLAEWERAEAERTAGGAPELTVIGEEYKGDGAVQPTKDDTVNDEAQSKTQREAQPDTSDDPNQPSGPPSGQVNEPVNEPVNGDESAGPRPPGAPGSRLASNVVPAPTGSNDPVQAGSRRPRHLREDDD